MWWGPVNQALSPDTFEELYKLAIDHYNTVDKVYIFDGYAGASPKSRKSVRFISELAWQAHFVHNMFLRPTSDELLSWDTSANPEPDFTIINACKVSNGNWKEQGLKSDVFVAFNIEKKIAVIGGTWYGGEMKKGIFSMMNYWLPLQGTMTMHCSANVGENGDTALFFGLSGTGKTTLSTDPHRFLIGDDEHGWDEDGIFNLEGGCYAKTINLSPENEPDIYAAIRPGALLENIHVDPVTAVPDFYNVAKTENARVSYPLDFIARHEPSGRGGHPKHIILLTCDAFGVLPPVSRLTVEQALYHFLSGYTAKVAGTERGITEPQATFSAGFGAAFLTLHPTKYADLLRRKLEKHASHLYLVNTGWIGGPYGTGKRMSIKNTRACIDAILDDSILTSAASFEVDPVFGFEIPTVVGGVAKEVLNPRQAWSDPAAYDKQRLRLAEMFIANYHKYVIPGVTDYSVYGPQIPLSEGVTAESLNIKTEL